jgi:hypothetical protein
MVTRTLLGPIIIESRMQTDSQVVEFAQSYRLVCLENHEKIEVKLTCFINHNHLSNPTWKE